MHSEFFVIQNGCWGTTPPAIDNIEIMCILYIIYPATCYFWVAKEVHKSTIYPLHIHFLFKRHLYETGLVLNFPDSLLFICSPAISGVSGYQFLHIWKLVLFGGSIRKQTNKKTFFKCVRWKKKIFWVFTCKTMQTVLIGFLKVFWILTLVFSRLFLPRLANTNWHASSLSNYILFFMFLVYPLGTLTFSIFQFG